MNPYFDSLQTLRQGKTLLFPTDTVWGLGCDATNPAAVEQLYSLKKLAEPTPFVLLIADIGMLSVYVEKMPEVAWDIVEFAEKPLTIIYPKGKSLAPNVLGANGSVAIRLVKDTFCQGLIHRFGKAVVATIPNLAGKPRPQSFSEISNDIKNNVGHILQPTEEMKKAQPSQIIRLGLGGDIEFIRK